MYQTALVINVYLHGNTWNTVITESWYWQLTKAVCKIWWKFVSVTGVYGLCKKKQRKQIIVVSCKVVASSCSHSGKYVIVYKCIKLSYWQSSSILIFAYRMVGNVSFNIRWKMCQMYTKRDWLLFGSGLCPVCL